MDARIGIDTKEFEKIQRAIKIFGDNADQEISAYLQEEGGKKIMKSISRNLPASGRKWPARKTTPARTAALARPERVFKQSVKGLTVTVASSKNYGYLYFPDDGSNTKRHHGNQKFMLKGAEQATEEIIEGAVDRLTKKFDGG